MPHRSGCLMRRTDNDLLGVADRELDRLDQDELLRLVVITRDGEKSDTNRAKKAWETLVALDIDRVRQIVATFRFSNQPGVRVHESDVDDATISCFRRLVKMLGTFKGSSMGEYR